MTPKIIKAIIQPINESTNPNPPPRNIFIQSPTFVTTSSYEKTVVDKNCAEEADTIVVKPSVAYAGALAITPTTADAVDAKATLCFAQNALILQIVITIIEHFYVE